MTDHLSGINNYESSVHVYKNLKKLFVFIFKIRKSTGIILINNIKKWDLNCADTNINGYWYVISLLEDGSYNI